MTSRWWLDQRLQALGLTLASGILLALPFLWPSLWVIHYVALVPWAILVTRPTLPRSWLYCFAGGYVAFALALLPFRYFHILVPLAAAAWLSPFVILFALVVRTTYLRFRVPLTLLVPVAWVAAEWLRLRLGVGQVAIFPLGTAQAPNLTLIQIADVSGVAGVSFIVAMGSGAVADVLRAPAPRTARALWPVALFPLTVAGALLYGAYRRGGAAGSFIDGPRIAIIQPNAKHYRDADKAKIAFDDQVRFARAAVTPGTADLIVLPENTVSVPIGDDPRYLEELTALAREKHARIIVGAFSRASVVPFRVYTSAYYLSGDSVFLERYHKLHLLPWAEYMPFDGWLHRVSPTLSRGHYAFTERMFGSASFGVPGRRLVLFPIKHSQSVVRFAVPICFEVATAGFAREAVEQGADFLLNITSEGVFGPPVYLQMLAQSRFRAVENRVPVVRVGNNGISGIIDPTGRIRSVVRGNTTGRLYLEAGTLVDRVPINPRNADGTGGTFYTRHGDVLAYLCIGASLLLCAASLRSSKARKESSAPGIFSRPYPDALSGPGGPTSTALERSAVSSSETVASE